MDIDDSGFELGMPSHQELLEHQCDMLCNENDELRQDLAKAKRNIEKLVEINAGLATSLRERQLHEQNDLEHRRPQHSVGTWGKIGNLITAEEAASIQENLERASAHSEHSGKGD